MDRQIILKGKDCTQKVRSIRHLPSGKYEVYFTGDSRRFEYSPQNVRIIQSALNDKASNDVFSYYRLLAREIGLLTGNGHNILETYYNNVKFINPESILASYLSGDLGNKYPSPSHRTIFPFGFNESQKTATNNAIDNNLSIIQGPPGTGKTQTILNIIANIVSEGKSVAVVSNNNSAIDNIYEKLNAHGIDFIVARLGSKDNKQSFIANQAPLSSEKMRDWLLTHEERLHLSGTLETIGNDIDNAHSRRNKVAGLQSEHDDLVAEQRHFMNYYNKYYSDAIPPVFSRRLHAYRILDVWHKANQPDYKIGILDKLWNLIIGGLRINEFYNQPQDAMIATLQKMYYERRIAEITKDIKRNEAILNSSNVVKKTQQYTDMSMDIFKSYIAEHYSSQPREQGYTLDDLWKKSESFIRDYPVILSTTYSLRNSLNKNHTYDYVVIDEASQVDVATFVLALSCAKNAVVVGDEKQLPNVVTTDVKKQDDRIFEQFNISEVYKYSTHSALSLTSELFGSAIPSQLLREHYRCHPKIIGFCSKMYYGGELIVLTDNYSRDIEPLKIYETVKGNHARDNHVNQRQIDVTLQEVVPNERLNLMDGSVGIVSPYRNHATALNDALKNTQTLAATVDRFQGRECDVIILNTVDNKISDFASNPNRLNVAVSRAKKQLIVVTNSNDNSTHTGIDELVNYIRYNDGVIVDSKVRSIFDSLYKSYYSRKTSKARKGSSVAEDLTFELLNEIHKEGGYTNLQIQLEYPLKLLVDIDSLTGRDREYAMNDLTRVDFIIFRKTSRQPVLAIETDGYAFHDNDKQRERDEIKNRLLYDAKVPLLRLSTIGSGEKKLIVDKLRELMPNS